MSIKSVLDSLTSEQRRRLIHAFDNGFGQHVTLEDGYFIGVNIKDLPNFEKLETVGAWSYGKISN